MPLPLALGVAMIAPQVIGMVQQGVMMHQMSKSNEKNEQMMAGLLNQGNQQNSFLTQGLGQGMPGQQYPGLA